MTGAPADDRGLSLGDGLFETVLFKSGAPMLWTAHLERLRQGCAVLGLPRPDPETLGAAAQAALAEARLEQVRAAVRLTWTAGSGGRGIERPTQVTPRLIVTAAPAPLPAQPARLILAAIRRNETSPAARLKSLSYLDNVLARREALAAGADDALMLNAAGHLACATVANLFWVQSGRLFTPALACGVLAGTMRGAVLAAAAALGAEVLEVRAEPAELLRAQAAFLTSSLIGLRPVASLEGRPLGDHSLPAALTAACAPVI